MAPLHRQGQHQVGDWSRHVPVARRRQAVLHRYIQRIYTRVSSRRARLAYLVVVYLIICAYVLVSTSPSVAFLALAPLLLLPGLGLLAYWLVWSDYHR